MPPKIKVLNEIVINRIAAGEVIERPMSVVKELLENAIDAGGDAISVEIENGGKRLIRIRDNGTGMEPDDAFLALERHATSKLTSEKDLVCIGTMGFRGEALASIASVSRLRLVTKAEGDSPGWEILVEGGIIRRSGEIGAGRGTTIEVQSLFFNTPVRRKFLKTPTLEADLIRELITRFALAFPSIGFRYTEDGKTKLDTAPATDCFERIHGIFAKDVRENLIPVEARADDSTLTGYIARPPYARSNMKSVLTFVNGRSVRDRLINMAVNRAFANLMERGRYPFAILFLNTAPENVDVNVHPQKAEVRFAYPKIVADLITNGIVDALTGNPFRQGNHSLERSLQPSWRASATLEEPRYFPEPQCEVLQPRNQEEPVSHTFPDRRRDEPTMYSRLSVLGTLPNSFIALYDDNALIVLDHHAAHERLLFDRLSASVKSGESCASQALLLPEPLDFSRAETQALREQLALLTLAGFTFEDKDGANLFLTGIPEWWNSGNTRDFFELLIKTYIDTGVSEDPETLRMEVLKTLACRSAVKETTSLSLKEISVLLQELDRAGSVTVCPHGRPFTVQIPLEDIRKKMGR